MDYVEPIAYTEEEASKLKMAYITFRYTSTAGSQEASSSNNRSSAEVPTFKVFAPFFEIHPYTLTVATVHISIDIIKVISEKEG